jgi:hypothetical protein
MAGKFAVSMVDPPIRHARPQRKPDVDRKILSQHAALPPRAAMSAKLPMLHDV